MTNLLRSDFSFELPNELIAQQPTIQRRASRLLHIDANGHYLDRQFPDLLKQLDADDLLVFNNTKVIPARLFGHKETGGRVEILLERLLDPQHLLVQLRASKTPAAGSTIYLEDQTHLTVVRRVGSFFELSLPAEQPAMEVLQRLGHIPLPPYIQRADTKQDSERYQTVYASEAGAVAAPTAGLHFDQDMLEEIATKGIQSAYVTLHVGAGTFSPIRVDDLSQHQMHKEWLRVSAETCQQIAETKARGGRVIAVGTTSVRSLETAASDGELKPYEGDTQLFITPDYQFHVVDALLTNFHLPESTLIMLVCAFAGKETVMEAYRHAVQQRYRFFSYGDAMFLEKQQPSG